MENEIQPDKMIDPNWVDPITGKKNNPDGWAEPEPDLAGNYFAQGHMVSFSRKIRLFSLQLFCFETFENFWNFLIF